MMETKTISKVEYIKSTGEGVNKNHWHNVTFEGEEKSWNIGAKQELPKFLAVGQSLNYEITDETKRKIKRASTAQMGNKSTYARSSGTSFKKKEPELVDDGVSLIRKLSSYNESDLIFFDIETASVVKELKDKTPLHDAWAYKARYENELMRKTGGEEPMTLEEYFDSKAALYPVFGKVVAIVAGRITKEGALKTKSYSGEEAEMLTEFNSDIEKMLAKNPKAIFAGWANLGFDQPFLQKRMIINGIRPNVLLDQGHKKPWEIDVVDLKDLWKGTGFYPDSLIATAVALGLPSPKNKMDGSQVSGAFYAGKIKDIVKYCTADVLTTANIYRKFMGKELLTLE